MAAASPTASALPTKVVIKTEPDSEEETEPEPEDVAQLREPVVPLLSPVCGLQPLLWSQDHRLAVSTTSAVSVIELRCDIQSPKQQLTLHRTAISVTQDEHRLQVGSSKQQQEAYAKFSVHEDPAIKQAYLANTVMNPMINLPKGVKYVSWSPLGCDARGCCLLACLSLHHRLTIHQSHRHLEWSTQADLSKKYGARLKERGYAKKDNVPPKASLLNFDELRRRFSMQTPVRMEWSSIYTTQQLLPNNVCEDTEIVLLAVLMENGDLVLWKFVLPFTTEEDIEFYDIIESGVDQPSDLAWWEYESGNRRMSGLIIGSQSGPVKIMPVSLTGIKGYFTLRHPVILWKETDQIAVKNIKCVPMIHSVHKASCSLIVASRGCYVFWCLLMISNAGLNIHNSHVAGLYSLPIVSLAVSQHPVAIYTCASDGWIKRLTPTFTEKSLFFKQEDIVRTENMAGRRMHGLAVSHNGAYMAIASTQGISPTTGFHPLERTYQVHFMALKSANAAAKILLSSPVQNLYKMADLLDIVRLQILEEKQIPTALQQELDKRIQEQDLMYLWKFKLFLVRTLYLSLQRPKVGVRWKPMQEVRKRLVSEEEEEAETTTATTTMDGEEDMQTEGETQKEREGPGINRKILLEKEEDLEEHKSEVQAWINSVETHLMRENMKRVLGTVYLNFVIAHKASIPTCGLVQYLSTDNRDRDAEVLIGHIKNKLYKQTFREHCSLCEEVLPFDDYKQATCANGHVWPRCGLSYQACQAVTFRRCLLLDSISRLPEPEDPVWIQKMLQAPCALCDSPFI
ncbi:general transcription factor 3C polypeptide 4 isoform X1 [Periophthalmus magnuspinnatus]|uniref:general transcription factor 3C polypeptide 4 isoform X1 n=1 Tax=Periophthalmus magnuspinnatus TaxID=409849 RepID=UPI002437227B|nr:general transcription factor 3C polypeptide 4 isoform X1 [Periophthalmus magnuspinnatus]